jgi:hypothetical protein
VGDPRQAAEVDVVLAGDAGQALADALAQRRSRSNWSGKALTALRAAASRSAAGVVVQALLELVQPVVQRLDQQRAPFGVFSRSSCR